MERLRLLTVDRYLESPREEILKVGSSREDVSRKHYRQCVCVSIRGEKRGLTIVDTRRGRVEKVRLSYVCGD